MKILENQLKDTSIFDFSDNAEAARKNAMIWRDYGHTGVSSLTMWQYFMFGDKGHDYPGDAGDFSRCYSLLLLVPQWRKRVGLRGKCDNLFTGWI